MARPQQELIVRLLAAFTLGGKVGFERACGRRAPCLYTAAIASTIIIIFILAGLTPIEARLVAAPVRRGLTWLNAVGEPV